MRPLAASIAGAATALAVLAANPDRAASGVSSMLVPRYSRMAIGSRTSCGGVPCVRTLPSLIRYDRSVILSTSCTSWSVSRMPIVLSLTRPRTIWRMSALVSGSTPANGSSSRIRFGSQTRQRAISSRRFSPPEQRAALLCRTSRQAELLDDLFGPVPALGPRQLPAEAAAQRQHFEDGQDVLLDGQLAEDRLFLRQIAHAEAGPAVHRQAGHVLAVEDDLAVVGRDLAGGHAEAGGLAGPVGPEQADDLAGVHGVGDAVHDLPPAVVLDQSASLPGSPSAGLRAGPWDTGFGKTGQE